MLAAPKKQKKPPNIKSQRILSEHLLVSMSHSPPAPDAATPHARRGRGVADVELRKLPCERVHVVATPCGHSRVHALRWIEADTLRIRFR
jgi:hypothetical protein